MRKKVVAGNWKMNKNLHECILLADDIRAGLELFPKNQLPTVILAPAFPFLYAVSQTLGVNQSITTSAQNCSSEKTGAYTGEVSVDMIRSTGARYVIIGHSERRSLFLETEDFIRKKLIACIEADLAPILCIGEKSEERKSARYFEVVKKQIDSATGNLSSEMLSKLVIAYEPVWAIGTGVHASPAQAQEMHAFIRQSFAQSKGMEFSQTLPILYGGSCNPGNAKELFSCKDVDGGLIGGASLNASDFLSIIKAAMDL